MKSFGHLTTRRAAAPQALIDAYLAALDEVKALRTKKSGMDEANYYAKLEAVLLKAARSHRDIRRYAAPASSPEPVKAPEKAPETASR